MGHQHRSLGLTIRVPPTYDSAPTIRRCGGTDASSLMSLNISVLRIVRDAYTLLSHTCKVPAVEDQPSNPFVFACLALLCQPPRQLDNPRGGEVTGRRAAEVCWQLGFGHCICLYLSAGDSGRIHVVLPHICENAVLSLPPMVASRT